MERSVRNLRGEAWGHLGPLSCWQHGGMPKPNTWCIPPMYLRCPSNEEWVQIQILIPSLLAWVKNDPRELLRITPVSFGI